MRKIDKIHIHHSESPTIKDWEKHGSEYIFNWIRNWHMKKRNFVDIGYHFVVMPDGNIWEGRPISVKPASIENHNSGAISLCFIGNFDIEDLPEKEKTSMVIKIQKLCEEYNIPIDNDHIIFHREQDDEKTCPGMKIKKNEFLKFNE